MSKPLTPMTAVIIVVGMGLVFGLSFVLIGRSVDMKPTATLAAPPSTTSPTPSLAQNLNLLTIKELRAKSYPGSPITIEQTLGDGANYHQYIASYLSEDLKIYALLTVPKSTPPAGGWPAILFNHGYIQPDQYRTTERYVAYVAALARSSYVVFKPDYRGNGNSQGEPGSAYYSSGYVIDDLNALTSIKNYPGVNPQKIGIWGHSLGGNLTLKDLVVNPSDIKAAVIWGGVVGSYDDLINHWQNRVSYHPAPTDLFLRNQHRQELIQTYGIPSTNPTFWNSIDPIQDLQNITAPVQLDVGGSDQEVPVDFSQSLYDRLTALGKLSEIYIYPGSDHNIAQGFNLAMQRTVAFFDKYLKTN